MGRGDDCNRRRDGQPLLLRLVSRRSAAALPWADFMTSLVHGTELQTVAIHLPPLTEVQSLTAPWTRSPATARSMRRSTRPRTTPRSTRARRAPHPRVRPPHAASRANPPFDSEDYGTKRWASYENVCSRDAGGRSLPRRRGLAPLHAQPRRGVRRDLPVAERAEARPPAGVVDARDARRSHPTRRRSRCWSRT